MNEWINEWWGVDTVCADDMIWYECDVYMLINTPFEPVIFALEHEEAL